MIHCGVGSLGLEIAGAGLWRSGAPVTASEARVCLTRSSASAGGGGIRPRRFRANRSLSIAAVAMIPPPVDVFAAIAAVPYRGQRSTNYRKVGESVSSRVGCVAGRMQEQSGQPPLKILQMLYMSQSLLLYRTNDCDNDFST